MMPRFANKRILTLCFATAIMLMPHRSWAIHPWVQPTPEELSMTSFPKVPGAPAVVLDYEEMDDDKHLHQHSVYKRIKILTEKGKDYADIELRYTSQTSRFMAFDEYYDNYTDIAGRTIHPDGTIIPFTGKPYSKLLEDSNGYKYQAKVFSLPDVQVGSIIEYHYTFHYPETYVVAPSWFIQQKLFVLHAHYQFIAEEPDHIDVQRGDVPPHIEIITILPEKISVQESQLSPYTYDLNVNDIEPIPNEDYMPPLANFSQRVLFYYFGYSSIDKFWKSEGKYNAKLWDKFIGPGSLVADTTAKLIGPSDTQQIKLKKIYDYVQQLENTDYTRVLTKQEVQAAGIKKIQSTDDVLQLKRGNDDEIDLLFIAMARAAGFKAYVMRVVNRDSSIFSKTYSSWNQLDDDIAIVNIDGKEEFFDPGSRYCKFGQLEWKHTGTEGVRQLDNGTDIAQTPMADYKQSLIKRVGVLTIAPSGTATGILQVAYLGSPALNWRQRALKVDSSTLNKDLEDSIKSTLPADLDLTFKSIANLTNPDLPLLVTFDASGSVGTVTGKHLIVPADLYRARTKPLFTSATRKLAIYLDYPYINTDVLKFQLPPNVSVETLPEKQSFNYKNFAAYTITTEPSANNTFTVARQNVLANVLYLVNEYNDVRDYFNKVAQSDQEVLLLKASQ